MSRRTSKSEDEDAWVFDSLVGFLRGPVWNVPILTFIEHKSLIFEPDTDENEEEYKKIHDEFKNLVDFMLGSYMEDIGISSEQFEKACGVASTKIKTQFHHTLFEQVWAADDFEIFKSMMIQKNIELQLQALELLKQRYGVLPSSLRPGQEPEPEQSDDDQDNVEDGERKIMAEVAKKSMADHEANQDTMDEDTRAMEEAVANSGDEIKRLEAHRTNQHQLLAEHFKTKIDISDPSLARPSEDASLKLRRQSETRVPKQTKLVHKTKDDGDTPIATASNPSVDTTRSSKLNRLKKANTISHPISSSSLMKEEVMGADYTSSLPEEQAPDAPIDEEELQKRTEFLRAQRDKLLAMKKEERERQLAEAEKDQLKSRPKSARAARSAFGRGRPSTGAGLDPEVLRIRRALAEKLKHEVIGDN